MKFYIEINQNFQIFLQTTTFRNCQNFIIFCGAINLKAKDIEGKIKWHRHNSDGKNLEFANIPNGQKS